MTEKIELLSKLIAKEETLSKIVEMVSQYMTKQFDLLQTLISNISQLIA
ncbi:hypothetical protein [Bartonella sp. A05]|nr:hypothetical protein [Bartonella sp. A05]MCZ2204429.1 hypothetical protein [Bartonella sp. A05]